MGRKTLDAGLKMSGGVWPESHLVSYVFSRTKSGERDGYTFATNP
jgi:hypothetical protein